MASVMTKKRLAIIGSGNIVKFHVPAMRRAGFDVVSCCSSYKSSAAVEFAKQYDIPTVNDSYKDLIDNESEWDALLIAISVEPTIKVLKEFIDIGKPILVEKPVSISSSMIDELKKQTRHIQVAYNRRFYNSVDYAKKFISTNPNCLIKMFLPDNIDFSISRHAQDYMRVKENSVHGLDILNYLVPKMKLQHVDEYKQPNSAYGKVVLLSSDSGHKCMIFLNWNAPSNFSLEIDSLPYKLELKPFERYSLFKGMEVIEPTESYPVRQYVPRIIESGTVFDKIKDFKPGFLTQSEEFMKLVEGKESKISANLNDAYNAIKLVEDILNFKCH